MIAIYEWKKHRIPKIARCHEVWGGTEKCTHLMMLVVNAFAKICMLFTIPWYSFQIRQHQTKTMLVSQVKTVRYCAFVHLTTYTSNLSALHSVTLLISSCTLLYWLCGGYGKYMNITEVRNSNARWIDYMWIRLAGLRSWINSRIYLSACFIRILLLLPLEHTVNSTIYIMRIDESIKRIRWADNSM